MKKLICSLLIVLFISNYCFGQTKIEPELQEIIENNNDLISVNIIFKAQIDETELNDRAKNFNDKKARREFVINELKHFSEKTQYEVLSIINTQERNGKASNITTHWLSNSITCSTTKDVIYLLSEREDIMLIGHNTDRDALLTDHYRSEKSAAEITSNVTQVNAPEVWEQGYTGEGVLVAILDTGVNYEHPDLADHLWDGGAQYPNHGYNSYDGSNVTMDQRGHGTHCAGTLCGDGTSGKQTGIAPNVTLMCIKALNDEGSANANSICSGIEFAVEHGAEVLSMSLGIANSSISDRTMIRQTCVNALEAGVIASVAAGNEGGSQNANPIPNNVRVPGSCPAPWIHPDQQENAGETSCVVSVGAVNSNDIVSNVSSRGPVTWENTSFGDYPYNPEIGLIRPDICAPGVDVVSLDFSSDGYVKMTGTSMAAPCVAGVMCLMLSKEPELTPAEISMLLETSAVKLSEHKNNDSGSGRVDALAAVNAIDMGAISFVSMNINDDNNNSKINPGEEISFNINLENTSSDAFNNITAVLSCENEWIEITQNEAEISSIAANETFSINNAFIVKINENAQSKTKLFMDIEFYDGSDRIAKTRFTTDIFDNTIRYSSIKILNDDNGNGILEAGETADMVLTLNNEGNEIAIGLEGMLTSDNANITINEKEASFNNIAPNGSASASFNVTVSNNAGNNINIPLNLEVKDLFDRTNNFNIDYAGQCNLTYILKDEYGDGWNGAKIIAHYSDGSEDDVYTITNGGMETFTKTLNSGVEVSLEWKNGGVDTECSYEISYENGVEIFSGKGRQQGTFFSWIYDCSCQSMTMVNCEPVDNFTVNYGYDFLELSWEAPAEDVLYYEVYRQTELMTTTEELTITDENLSNGTYVYNVRPVYENCFGELSGETIVFNVNIDETETAEASIYPNPSNDRFVIRCEAMRKIEVFNIMGEMIVEKETDNDIYVLEGLDSGIYFINISTDNNSIVRKIVRY